MATGLGKTYLAAFDLLHVLQQPAFKEGRVLFVVHRHEILQQAASTFRRLFSGARFGFFIGDKEELSAPFIFASVQ